MKNYLKSLLLLLCVASCETPQQEVNSLVLANHHVPLAKAQIIAQNPRLGEIIGFKNPSNKTAKLPTNTHKLDSTIVVAEQTDTLLYIFTYEKGGFCIISADDRHRPILAYSENSKFELQGANAGIINWFDVQSKGILAIKKGEIQPDAANNFLWQRLLHLSGLPANNTTCAGQPIAIESIGLNSTLISTTTVGPLLQTTWGQGCGYNDLLNAGCSSNCGRQLTGCVATSMAQVMRRWSKPTNYNWASMPNNQGSPEVSRLMRDAGVNAVMNYGCEASGTNHDKAANALRNNFGYTSAVLQNYNYSTVRDNLFYGQPVILGGCHTRNSFLGITTGYDQCHSWVCDGYIQSVYCEYSTLLFHMNWGWNSWCDGWFVFDNWGNGAGRNYQYAKDMIVNIR